MPKIKQVRLESPSPKRAEEFLDAVSRSRALHKNRATPPSTRDGYENFVKSAITDRRACFFIVDGTTDDLAGVINISEIVRGSFQSAYLGYYALLPYAGTGYMHAGLVQALNCAFGDLKIHRLEANIQPANGQSIRLAQSLGFRLEGFSPKYLKVSGRWRDHERWAILREEWRAGRGRRTG